MYQVQGTLREWVTRDEVRRFIARKFKDFLLTYVNPKNEHRDKEYVWLINDMVSGNIFSTVFMYCTWVSEICHFYMSLVIVSIMQLVSAVWRLIINNLSMFIPTSLFGWLMRLSLS